MGEISHPDTPQRTVLIQKHVSENEMIVKAYQTQLQIDIRDFFSELCNLSLTNERRIE
jgi:hypothetical protein